ncbi:MAG: hypothetical protein JO321_07140, partial [Solirubrobacterales bacterium]|nr:hypothetical protein [Solirubrobacterales bacterium]
MATHRIRAVWREIGAFPAMRRLGIPEVLQFEHTSDDLPDLGTEFHVTHELASPQQASGAMAQLWLNDRPRALEVAHWLGDCTGRIESLDWRRVPRANSPERSVEIGARWRRPQHGQLLARSDCPAWARTLIDQVSETLSRPEAFDSFGGWGGELLQARDGRFVLIDWPSLGAAPRGSLAALALEILLRFGAADPAPLVERFFAGWVPAGLDESRLEDLRVWWTHGILWWTGLSLSLSANSDVDLADVYAAAWHSLENDNPVSWLSRDAAEGRDLRGAARRFHRLVPGQARGHAAAT